MVSEQLKICFVSLTIPLITVQLSRIFLFRLFAASHFYMLARLLHRVNYFFFPAPLRRQNLILACPVGHFKMYFFPILPLLFSTGFFGLFCRPRIAATLIIQHITLSFVKRLLKDFQLRQKFFCHEALCSLCFCRCVIRQL